MSVHTTLPNKGISARYFSMHIRVHRMGTSERLGASTAGHQRIFSHSGLPRFSRRYFRTAARSGSTSIGPPWSTSTLLILNRPIATNTMTTVAATPRITPIITGRSTRRLRETRDGRSVVPVLSNAGGDGATIGGGSGDIGGCLGLLAVFHCFLQLGHDTGCPSRPVISIRVPHAGQFVVCVMVCRWLKKEEKHTPHPDQCMLSGPAVNVPAPRISKTGENPVFSPRPDTRNGGFGRRG